MTGCTTLSRRAAIAGLATAALHTSAKAADAAPGVAQPHDCLTLHARLMRAYQAVEAAEARYQAAAAAAKPKLDACRPHGVAVPFYCPSAGRWMFACSERLKGEDETNRFFDRELTQVRAVAQKWNWSAEKLETVVAEGTKHRATALAEVRDAIDRYTAVYRAEMDEFNRRAESAHDDADALENVVLGLPERDLATVQLKLTVLRRNIDCETFAARVLDDMVRGLNAVTGLERGSQQCQI